MNPKIRGYFSGDIAIFSRTLNIINKYNKQDGLFRLMLKDKPFDVFSVSETWLNSDISGCEFAIEGY